MLQIISGKFFNSSELSKSEGYNVFYSNYFWIIETDTGIAKIIPFFEGNGDFAYVIRYLNQIEKEPVLVRTGDDEIVKQFEALCIFGLQAIFDTEKDTIKRVCRPSKGRFESIRPSKFVSRYFDPQINGTNDEILHFSKFIKKVIGLPRKKYNSIINCMIAYSNSLKLLDYNFDLAYSMLIYCLESLAQKNQTYNPIWIDYSNSQEIDKILIDLDLETSSKIRNTILKDQHLKLQRRFIKFVLRNISDSFFIEESQNIKRPIRISEIEKALANAYSMRSSYAHELAPILQHLKVPAIAEGDVFHFENSPYFTYSGLIRLTHHVITNYIFEQEYLDKETYNWHSELPNMLRMEMVPRMWIWRTDGENISNANHRFSGFLSELMDSIINHEPITNCKDLMDLYESKISQTSGEMKDTILIHYCLYNISVSAEYKSKKFLTIINDQNTIKIINSCKIGTMTLSLLTKNEWNYEVNDSVKVYQNYKKQKFSRNAIVLPQLLEILILVKIANSWLAEGHPEKYYEWVNLAYLESSGQKKIQDLFKSKFDEGEVIDFNSVFSVIFP